MKIWIPILCAVALLAGCSGKKDPEVAAPDVVYWHQLEERDDLVYFEEKPFTGVAVSKYPNGQKFKERTFKDGKEHGLTTRWYESGQKKDEGTFKDGKLVSATAWKPNGEKCPDTNVVDGTGIWCFYHDNGQKKAEYTYKDGEEISEKWWDEDGTPID